MSTSGESPMGPFVMANIRADNSSCPQKSKVTAHSPMSLCLQGEVDLPQLPPTTHSTAEAGLLGQRRPQLLPQHWNSAGSSLGGH